MPSIAIMGIVVLATNDFSGVIHARRRASLAQPATISSCSIPTFAPITNLNAGTLPVGIAAADFNGEGKIDLAVANSTSNNVSGFLNNGSGSFGGPTDYPAGTNPGSIDAGKFNVD